MQGACKRHAGEMQGDSRGHTAECRGNEEGTFAGGMQGDSNGECTVNAGSISSKRAFFLLVLWVATLVCLPCSRHEFMRVWTNASTHYVLIQVMRAQFVAGM